MEGARILLSRLQTPLMGGATGYLIRLPNMRCRGFQWITYRVKENIKYLS